jgi:hypothetical protein
MESKNVVQDDIQELGAVSVETKGYQVGPCPEASVLPWKFVGPNGQCPHP